MTSLLSWSCSTTARELAQRVIAQQQYEQAVIAQHQHEQASTSIYLAPVCGGTVTLMGNRHGVATSVLLPECILALA